MTAGKRGRPRKNPTTEPAVRQPSAPSFDGKAVRQINAALDRLAIARDYASSIEAGGETPKDLEELAGETRKAICEAGENLERGLCSLGILTDGKGGWFVPDLERSAVA